MSFINCTLHIFGRLWPKICKGQSDFIAILVFGKTVSTSKSKEKFADNDNGLSDVADGQVSGGVVCQGEADAKTCEFIDEKGLDLFRVDPELLEIYRPELFRPGHLEAVLGWILTHDGCNSRSSR